MKDLQEKKFQGWRLQILSNKSYLLTNIIHLSNVILKCFVCIANNYDVILLLIASVVFYS